MFIRWPQTWLLLLFASAVLSGHPQSSTPHDPFHAIAALAPKPSEELICCLKHLAPLEPVDDDIFLSFEDWKAKRFSESSNSQRNNVPPPNTNTSPPLPRVPAAEESPAEAAAAAVVDTTASRVPETAADAALPQTVESAGMTTPIVPALAPPPPPPPGSVSPHFRVPLTDRFNYASVDCSARVHTAHPAAKSASNILSSKRDRYMLWPCNAAAAAASTNAGRRPSLFVVVELCDDIRIDTVQMANFEFFSGVFRQFTVSVAKTYIAADAEGWTVVGTYVGKNVRGVQVSFAPPKIVPLLFYFPVVLVVPSADVHSRLLSVHSHRFSLSLLKRVLLPHLTPSRLWPHAPRAVEVGHLGGGE